MDGTQFHYISLNISNIHSQIFNSSNKMIHTKSKFLKIVFIALFLFTASFAQTVKLKFVETSDVHGSLFSYDFIKGKLGNSSLAQIYNYVQQERAKQGQEVILLDNGDILQGQPIVYYYNF